MYGSLLRVPVWLRVAFVVVVGVVLFGLLVPVATDEPVGGVQLLGALGVLALLAGVVVPAVAPEVNVGASAGHLTREERREVLRAALGGPAPSEPALRTAAHELARSQRDEAERRWRWALVVAVVGAVAYVLVALATSLWWLVVAALIALLPPYWQLTRRRLARRVEMLGGSNAGA